MSLANMESVKIIENDTTMSNKVNTATTPSVKLSKENSSNEHGTWSQKSLVDPKEANDKKEPKLSKSKKKKKNTRKGKSKDSVSIPQNGAKDEIKTQDSEPEKSGEVSMDSDKEEHKKFNTEVLLDQPSVLVTQEEYETDLTITQRQATISKDDAINTEASETRISELANLGTKASDIEYINNITAPENTSICLSNTDSITSESKQQDNPPNPDGSSKVSYCNSSSAGDDKQDEFNVQENSENVEELQELTELKNPHLVVSSTDELVKENADLDSQALTNNPISETGDFKVASDSFMAETSSISPIEDNFASTPLESESRSLVPEKTSIELLKDAAINKKTLEVTVQNKDSTSLVESGLASTSTILTNLEDKIVKDVKQTLSTINLFKFSQVIPGSIFQEPELSSSTQLKETDIETQAEQKTTDKTIDDKNETGITPHHRLNELTDIASKLLNINSEIQITSSNNVSDSSASINAEISEVRDLSDTTATTNEHVTSELQDVSGDVKHILHPKVSISDTSAVLDGNIISNKKINMTEPPALAEETITSVTSSTDFKKLNVETGVVETNNNETTDIIDFPVETDESNVSEDKAIGSDDKKVPESIGNISTNEEVLENHSDSIHSVQNELSSLCTHSKTLKEQDKELTSDVLRHASATEERSTGSQDHTQSIINETFQSENWKNSLEFTAGKAISLIDTKVAQASNLIGILRHSKSEFPDSEIVSTTPSDSKNDEIHSQNSAQFSKIEEKSSEENLSNAIHTDISNSKEKSDSAVDLDEVKSDGEVSAISPTNDVFGSSASQAEITNKTKLKFKPSVGEQALAPELVTISKETLDLLYKRLDSMQLEIERLSSALKSQNETTPAPLKDNSNSSLKDDYVIAESSQQISKIIEGEEIVNVGPLKQPSKNKSMTKPSCLWRLMSIFGYKTITKSDAGLVTRSVSENLLSPSPQRPKGKGKEIVAQSNKPSAARTYKVIGRVRAKHDLY